MSYTIVFNGDVRDLSFNPLTEKTRYGTPTALMCGDALLVCYEQSEKLTSARNLARDAATLLHEAALNLNSTRFNEGLLARIDSFLAYRR